MQIIGRIQEQATLKRLSCSNKPELLAVYGRRRIGKTYLIREYFNNAFAFQMTGSRKLDTPRLLKLFDAAMKRHFESASKPARDWLHAFEMLREQLQSSISKQRAIALAETTGQQSMAPRHIVFIDELPWFDRGKSGFLAALEQFWNDWASSQPEVLLIVCGSSTSWIVKKIFHDQGGLHNRITARIELMPFTLRECEEYFSYLGIAFNRYHVLESYLIFGGVPYYLSLFDKAYAVTQNVDRLLFAKGAILADEYGELFSSLFSNPERHTTIVEALTDRYFGLTREEIAQKTSLPVGGSLSNTLFELEQCGFITRFTDFTKPKKVAYYRLIDPFVLFYLRFVKGNHTHNEFFWTDYVKDAGYHSWSGLAFEQVCSLHIAQIRAKLGISGVSMQLSSWRSAASVPGAQIDLLIDRKDGIINVCEIKYSNKPYTIDADFDKVLQRKLNVFADETGTRKALHLTMITTYGLSGSGYQGGVQAQITMDDLFA